MNEAHSSGPLIDRDAAAALMEPLTDLVVRAGAAILAVNRAAMRVDGKLDGSPVTEADLAADRIICDGLARLVPGIPALSEERVHLAKPPYDGSFFLIDPLDGTKEFVAGRGEFTVNLALVTGGTPLLGIIGAPALGLIWRGLVGRGAERLATAADRCRAEPIHTRPHPAARRALDRGRQPLPWRRQDRSLYRGQAGRGPADARLGGQIRPGGGRGSRYLSAPCADLRMGCRGRTCDRNGGRRQDHRCHAAPSCGSGQGAAASSCRNSSPGATLRPRANPEAAGTSGYWARSCSSCGQRALACRRKRSGSAAKASRFSSRPNR